MSLNIIWLSERLFVHRLKVGGLGVRNLVFWFFLTSLCWGNGCGDMLWKGLLCGEGS